MLLFFALTVPFNVAVVVVILVAAEVKVIGLKSSGPTVIPEIVFVLLL